MNILAVVPARGGSKSIPRKNIKLLLGEPLIAYTLREAKRSKLIQRVVVTTDDPEIAEVAERYGSPVPFLRPHELAQDDSTDLEVFSHCLKWLKENEEFEPEILVHLRPTAPLRTAEHIDKAISLLLDSEEADSVRSVCKATQHPLKMWEVNEGWLRPFVTLPENRSIREPFNSPRQRLPEVFVQNGSIDVLRSRLVTLGNSMTGRRIKPFVMDESVSVNIDSTVDWELAELLLRRKAATLPGSSSTEV